MAGDRDHEDKALSRVIFQNDDYILRYEGPDPATVSRVVVTFPDLIHPAGPDAEGWGAAFLRKRGAAVLSLTFRKANWFQSPGFFPALDAARAFIGPDVAVSAYGASMGGYSAILAAARLQADRVGALCPQFTVQQDIAPFERRYRAEAAEIGPFIHDVAGELREGVRYFVMHDPTHRIDAAHLALFPKPSGWRQMVLPGASHGVLPTLIEMRAIQQLFDLIMGHASANTLRQAARAGRRGSVRYLRRMGNLCTRAPRRRVGLETLIDLARARGLGKFVKRWSAELQNPSPVRLSGLSGPEEVIIHVGLPKTGTTTIQTYFARLAEGYRARGLDYPLRGAGSTPHHGWFGKGLLSGDLSELDATFDKAQCARMVLSDETIFNEALFAEEAVGDALRERLSGRKVRLIACLRDPSSWQKSFYKQAVQNRGRPRAAGSAAFWGRSERFDAFFTLPDMARLARVDDMLARLESLFGCPVETIELQPGMDIVPVFLERIGLTPAEPMIRLGANPSLSDLDAEIMRQANAQGAGEHGYMRQLIERLPDGIPADQLVSRMRPGRKNLLQNVGQRFDWAALRYKPNPPLRYEEVEFVARCDELRARAEVIAAALDASEQTS
ncbi:MAG: hypothetical protein P8X43_04440 [Maritimibacter sp.]